MNSLKKQILWAVFGTAIATLLFGIGLSILVNYGLQQLEEQPDTVLPVAPPSNSESAPF